MNARQQLKWPLVVPALLVSIALGLVLRVGGSRGESLVDGVILGVLASMSLSTLVDGLLLNRWRCTVVAWIGAGLAYGSYVYWRSSGTTRGSQGSEVFW